MSSRGVRARVLSGCLAAALVLLAWVAPTRAAAITNWNAALLRAPYLTDLVATHVNINWATAQSATTGSLRWGPVSGGSCTLSHTLTASRSTILVGAVSEYQWKAALSLPGQGRYCYRPLLSSTDLLAANDSPQFQTQVAAGDATPFSFDVFGDWGQVNALGANIDQSNLYAQIAASGARFAVTVGDNGYPNGSQLNYGDLLQTGADTSAIFGPSFWTAAGSSIPLFPAAGNHGLSGPSHTDISTWTQDSAVSSSGGRYQNDVYCCVNGSASANYASEWYAFDAGKARFYLLDSAWGDGNNGTATVYANDAAAHFAPGTPEYSWLLNDLKTHPSALKFAFFHYPLYSDNPSQSSDTSLQGPNGLEGLLGQYGVDLVFNGHAHNYERNTPSAPGMPVSYVTGGGGGTLAPIGPCHSYDAYALGWSPTTLTGTRCGSAPVPMSASQVFHFLKVTVSGTTVTVAPTDETGHTFDVQSYTFSAVPDTVIDSAPPFTMGTATLTFHSTQAGASFACRLDGAAASACTSPATYTGLSDGQHSFSVAATTAGGTDPSPATAQWTVDTVAPSTPSNLAGTATAATGVSLSWTGSTDTTGVVGYDVQRNGATIGSSTPPSTSYFDATAGPASTYQYSVIARDTAGNVSPPSAPVTVTTPPATGAPTLVQSAGSSTSTVTLPGTSANGDLLVLTAGVYTGTSKPITAVSDGRNTWTKAGGYALAGQNSDGELWYAANAVSVRSVTVTTTAPVALRVQEYAGVAAANPLDGAVGTVAGSKSANSGSIVPSTANELAVGFVAGHANAQTMSVGSPGYTVGPQQTTTGTSTVSVVSGSQALTGTGAQGFAASFSNTMYWAAGVALFKPAAPPPPPDDFSIGAAPSSVSVTAGQSGSSTISTAVASGNAQSVVLSAAGLPSGITASFNPPSVMAGTNSTLTITVDSGAAPGTYPLVVTGTGPSVTHTASVSLTVNAVDDFSIGAAPSSVSVTAGQSGSSTISTAVTSGNAQSVAFSASGLPSGVTASFDPSSVMAGTNSTLTITVDSGAAPGTYSLVVTGTGASATHPTPVSLTVQAVPVDDFSIGAAPSSVTVTAGQSGSSSINTAVTSGNPQTVGLSVSTPPAGVTLTFDQTSVTAGASAVMTIDTAADAAAGSYTVVVTGTGASISRTTTVSLTVNPVVTDDFSIGAVPSTVTVTAGQSGTSTISTAVTNGAAQSVNLSASGLPSGASASFSPATVTAGGSSTMTIDTAASTAAGTVTLVVTGTGASTTHTTSISLTVNAVVTDDFSIAAAPSSITATAGQTATTTINTAIISGNAQSISLSASGTPAGAGVSFTPTMLTAGQSSSFAVATTSGTPPGSYSLTVTGTGASASHTVIVSLTVTGGATPPHQVQAVGATETSASTTLSATLPVASTAGDLLVLSVSLYTGATNHLTSVTDSAGNVWRKANAWSTPSHNSDGELWYAANAAATTTVTASVATAASMAFQVQEFTGIAAVNPLDASAGASNTGTSASSGPLTPAADGELLIGFVAGHANAQAVAVTPAGYTVLPQQTSTGSITMIVTGYQVLSPASAVSFAGSYPAAMYWAAGLAAFKPA